MNKSVPPTIELDDDWTDSTAKLAPETATAPRPKSVPATAIATPLVPAAPFPTPVVPGAPAARRSPATAQRPSGARLESSVCAFWLGAECFGLDVSLVGEVVNVDAVLPVPLAPAPLLGLFNLRGTAVALVDLAQVLALGGAPLPRPEPNGPRCALVLRTGELVAAAWIDRMEAVISPDRATFAHPSEGDGPVVKGFVEVVAHSRAGAQDTASRANLVVTLLDEKAVVANLKRLRFASA
jgi:chemotaxis signal transduction protein